MDLKHRKIFSKNLKYYMTLNGKDRNDLVKDLGFPYSSIRDWEKGYCYAKIDKIQKLANYFNIPTHKLIEDDKTAKTMEAIKLSDNQKLIESIITNLPALTTDELKHILQTVELLSTKK